MRKTFNRKRLTGKERRPTFAAIAAIVVLFASCSPKEAPCPCQSEDGGVKQRASFPPRYKINGLTDEDETDDFKNPAISGWDISQYQNYDDEENNAETFLPDNADEEEKKRIFAKISIEYSGYGMKKRIRAAYTFAEFGAKGLPYLEELVKDKNLDVRLAALEAMGALGDTALKTLSGYLKDQNSLVRMVALESVGLIGEKAKNELIKAVSMLEDKDELVSGAAYFAERDIKSKDAVTDSIWNRLDDSYYDLNQGLNEIKDEKRKTEIARNFLKISKLSNAADFILKNAYEYKIKGVKESYLLRLHDTTASHSSGYYVIGLFLPGGSKVLAQKGAVGFSEEFDDFDIFGGALTDEEEEEYGGNKFFEEIDDLGYDDLEETDTFIPIRRAEFLWLLKTITVDKNYPPLLYIFAGFLNKGYFGGNNSVYRLQNGYFDRIFNDRIHVSSSCYINAVNEDSRIYFYDVDKDGVKELIISYITTYASKQVETTDEFAGVDCRIDKRSIRHDVYLYDSLRGEYRDVYYFCQLIKGSYCR